MALIRSFAAFAPTSAAVVRDGRAGDRHASRTRFAAKVHRLKSRNGAGRDARRCGGSASGSSVIAFTRVIDLFRPCLFLRDRLNGGAIIATVRFLAAALEVGSPAAGIAALHPMADVAGAVLLFLIARRRRVSAPHRRPCRTTHGRLWLPAEENLFADIVRAISTYCSDEIIERFAFVDVTDLTLSPAA